MQDVNDIFGPMFKPKVDTSMFWAVKRESKVYNFKSMVTQLKLPQLPNNISQHIGWLSSVLAILASMDKSDSGILSHWWGMLENPTRAISEEWTSYHSNAQGLIRLDRLLGRLMATQHNFGHPLFGRQFKTYIGWSQVDAPWWQLWASSFGLTGSLVELLRFGTSIILS